MLYGSDEAPVRQVPLAVLLLLLLHLGPPVDAAQGGFGISLASHRWPEAEAAAVEAAAHRLGTCRNVGRNTAERQQERREEHHEHHEHHQARIQAGSS